MVNTFPNQDQEVIWTQLPNGATFYVATAANGGNDSNPGNRRNPLLTINAALAKVVDGRGDTIYLGYGAFVEDVLITKAGVRIFGPARSIAAPLIIPAGVADAAVTIQDVRNVWLKDLRIRHVSAGKIGLSVNADSATTAGAILENLNVQASADPGVGLGVRLKGAQFMAIRHCSFGFCDIGLGLEAGLISFSQTVVLEDCDFGHNVTADIATTFGTALSTANFFDVIGKRLHFSSELVTNYVNLVRQSAASENAFFDCWFHRQPSAGVLVTVPTGMVVLGRGRTGDVNIVGP